MHHMILKFSQKIERSTRYQNTKAFFRALLDDVNSPYKKYFDFFMISLIMVSIGILILSVSKTDAERSQSVPEWVLSFDLYFITLIFVLEYLLRLWVSHDSHRDVINAQKLQKKVSLFGFLKPKLKYMISLPALIDFVAIFPKFRMLRLLKLYHYMHGASSLFNALLKKRFEFVFLGYMLFGVTFALGSIFYLLEFGKNDAITSYLDAIYWALVTTSTVGYGDISPVTDIGKIVAMVGIVFGIAMISFVTSVMVSAFSERFDELRNQDALNHANKMHNVVIINGYGHLGRTIAKKLEQHKDYEAVIVEENEIKANRAIEDGYNVIRADGSSAKLIKALYQKNNIAAMLTLTSSDIKNIYFILNAKSLTSEAIVYSRMNQSSLEAQYRATKVDGLVEPYTIVDKIAFEYLHRYTLEKEKKILFLGYTYKSAHLCKMLQEDAIEVHIYDIDAQRLAQAKEDGFKHIQEIEQYKEELRDIKESVVICAMDDEALNVYYAITLRSHGFTEEIVALSDTKEDNRKLYLAGVSKIFDMYEESANHLIGLIQKI